MSGVILHPEKGVNPYMTFCRRCGGDGAELLLVGLKEYAEVCVECGMTALGGRPRGGKCPKCERSNGWAKKPLSDFMHEGKLPSMEPCDACMEELKLHEDEVAKGGIFFQCSNCDVTGVIKSTAPLAAEVRKAHGMTTPGEDGKYGRCGVEFTKEECPACGPEPLTGEQR